jgi:hypothetical protein
MYVCMYVCEVCACYECAYVRMYVSRFLLHVNDMANMYVCMYVCLRI